MENPFIDACLSLRETFWMGRDMFIRRFEVNSV